MEVVEIIVIISPAKTMNIDNDTIRHRSIPDFIEEAGELLDYLRKLSYRELKDIWKTSDKLTQLNFERLKDMDLNKNLSPAILSFEGLQYQYMGANVFTEEELDYIDKHLRILSGFYGILRPLDGIRPYRLEMQSKFQNWDYKSLYQYWGNKIAKSISNETREILDLASKEYSKSIIKHLPSHVSVIECVFAEIIDGKTKEKATLVKMARGEMVRFMAEKKVNQVKEVKSFNRLGYRFSEKLSEKNKYIFIKEKNS